MNLFLVLLSITGTLNIAVSDTNTKRLSSKRNYNLPLKYLYVGEMGIIQRRKSSGYWLTVEATANVSDHAHQRTALITARLTKHMPVSIFHTLCVNAKVGVFTRVEGLTSFLEYSHQRDTPQCRETCAGTCSRTCTSDGRKVSQLVGASGHGLAAILDDNVMCSDTDPYHGQSNILVHEFAHTVHKRALPYSIRSQITQAFQSAKQNCTWDIYSYAMSNEMEYFAEAVSSFFNVERLQSAAGGMNTCGRGLCQNETESREYIKQKDPKLYHIINYVYLNNNDTKLANLGNCVT
ncbi:uncharacterized protein LOC111117935 [Crassostrea virginica]|uniref:Uncharacterized protein LOC111117935 n=1 Tax=Crassostrea virginica TaxID=6565 RepID=A0A8B8CAY6_CRAVI|nr:uncharacterized protein LOC111117935 [Crassostrea virginica]XP_022312995.1 uncharacterized protein LOC111117935 [Crassostrea virginica]